jgi:tRNA A37 methylthiotransferase MiaB
LGNVNLKRSTPVALDTRLKIGFVSLGCPKNLVDSEVMMGQLVAKGHELTPHPDQAEVLVVNTCSFIDPAKKESVDTILEMAEYKKVGRARKLIVAGCLVERYRGDIRQEMPEVDALIGTNELDSIVALCEGMEPAGGAPSRICITTSRRACWPLRAISPTSKLPKAATIPAPSASSRSTAENSAAAASNR